MKTKVFLIVLFLVFQYSFSQSYEKYESDLLNIDKKANELDLGSGSMYLSYWRIETEKIEKMHLSYILNTLIQDNKVLFQKIIENKKEYILLSNKLTDKVLEIEPAYYGQMKYITYDTGYSDVIKMGYDLIDNVNYQNTSPN